ncbi:hypothetical protein [Streptomyces sp. SPB074]|uniref:hypothetical protein n=1 Tax=Streptomyces sp. (strain SPB074) TaxID=465543 RepID=UPI00017F1D35|nr:hypothetical protein [Streptomyces sp. SPB074]
MDAALRADREVGPAYETAGHDMSELDEISHRRPRDRSTMLTSLDAFVDSAHRQHRQREAGCTEPARRRRIADSGFAAGQPVFESIARHGLAQPSDGG